MYMVCAMFHYHKVTESINPSTFLDKDQFPAVGDPDVGVGPMAAVHLLVLNLRHEGHAADHMTKDHVNAEAEVVLRHVKF